MVIGKKNAINTGILLAVSMAASQGYAQGKAIEEVVVTATKREQGLQDVGLTVSAISGDMLEQKGINNVADLAKIVPGLNFSQSPESKPVYTLRGVGFYESTLAAYPDVATYIDQVSLPLPILSSLTAFDLERVEVLKGPQGTLFGNNATGGAINFVPAKPTEYFDAGVSLSYGRFDTFDVGGFVSGPLTDTLNARLAIKSRNSDGWQQSYTRDDDNGETDTFAARLLFDWNPTDRLSVLFNVNGWQDKSDPLAPQVQKIELQNPVGTCGFGGCIGPDMPFLHVPLAPDDNRAADWNPANPPYANNKFEQVAARVDYELTPQLTLTSLTSFIDFSMRMSTEGGGTYLEDLDVLNNPGNIETFSQELRLSGEGKDLPIRWMIGGNYEDTKTDEIFDTHYEDHSSGYQQGFTAARSTSEQDMENTAVFANVEYDVIESLTLKAGIRYTEAKRDVALATSQIPGDIEPPAQPGFSNVGIAEFFNFVWQNAYIPVQCPGVDFQPIVGTNSISINPATCQAGLFTDSLDEESTSWSIGADYRLTPDMLLYANISQGYKAGSYPIAGAATWDQYRAVTQESLLSYEAGFKSTWADGKVTFNGAAFYYDYEDKQLRAKVIDPIFGPLDALVNVPESVIKGAEFDIMARPVEGLTLALSATFLEAEVKKYDGVVDSTVVNGLRVPILADFNGVDLPFAPEWQLNASIDYEFAINQNWNMFLGANLSAQADTIGTLKLDAAEKDEYNIKQRAILDLIAGFATVDDKWRITFWGKNVTDKYYWINVNQSYDTVVRYAGRPAEYGVTVNYNF